MNIKEALEKDLLRKSKPDKESVEQWLSGDEEGKNFFQKLTDKRVTQSIETFKNNHFAEAVKAKVEEEIRSRYPDETEEQKRIRDLEKKFEITKIINEM